MQLLSSIIQFLLQFGGRPSDVTGGHYSGPKDSLYGLIAGLLALFILIGGRILWFKINKSKEEKSNSTQEYVIGFIVYFLIAYVIYYIMK